MRFPRRVRVEAVDKVIKLSKEVFPGSPGTCGPLVFEHEGELGPHWAVVGALAAQIGRTSQTLRGWVRQAEGDHGRRGGLTSNERERHKRTERESRERNRANEILRRVSAFFTRSGARPPAEAMMPFIDSRRAA